jgi:FkbM family methyltransferase
MPIVEVFFRHEYGPIRDGSTVIDVGASTGVFAVYALATARDVSVYAFEPNPATFGVLRQNVTANAAFGRIHAFNCALAASSGSRQLYLDHADFLYPTFVPSTRGEAARSASVPALTLSDVIEANSIRRVDLLKMDCEGAEYEILFETPMAMLARVSEIRMEYHELTGPERGRAALERFLGQAGFAVTHVEPKPMARNGILWARRADGGACRGAAGA